MKISELPNEGEFKGLRDLAEKRRDEFPRFTDGGMDVYHISWNKTPENHAFWKEINIGLLSPFIRKYPQGWPEEEKEPKFEVGKSYLITEKDAAYQQISKATIAAKTLTCYKVIYEFGNQFYYKIKDFEQTREIIEDLGETISDVDPEPEPSTIIAGELIKGGHPIYIKENDGKAYNCVPPSPEPEWEPQKGERILVWGNYDISRDEKHERIYLEGKEYEITNWMKAAPLKGEIVLPKPIPKAPKFDPENRLGLKDGDMYWSLLSPLNPHHCTWANDVIDDELSLSGNIYRTQTELQFASNKALFIQEIKDFIMVEDELRFNDGLHTIRYDIHTKEIVPFHIIDKFPFSIPLMTHKTAQKVIETYSADLLKYVFEV